MPKQIIPLSANGVEKEKPKEKDTTLFDGGGLYLLIAKQKYNPDGKKLPPSKLWRMKYRFNGKEKLLSFGAYPAISLADARERREDAKKLLANGVDPGEIKKAQKASEGEQDANTFEVIAREWHSKYSHTWVPSHAQHKLERLERNVFPWIGKRPIKELTAPDVLAVLRRMEARGILDTAHRVRFECSSIFRYAVATGRVDRDPVADLKGALAPVKNGHHAAPTDPKDVAPLLRAIDEYQGSFVVKCAMQLAPILFVRPGELRAAELREQVTQAAVYEDALREELETKTELLGRMESRLKIATDTEKHRRKLITETAQKSMVAVPVPVLEAMKAFASEDDFYKLAAFFESAGRVNFASLPMGQKGESRIVSAPNRRRETVEYGSARAAVEF